MGEGFVDNIKEGYFVIVIVIVVIIFVFVECDDVGVMYVLRYIFFFLVL